MTGSGVAASCSFAGLRRGHGLQRLDIVPAHEGEKRLLARDAALKIGLQDALDGPGHFVGGHVAIELAPDRRVRPETAADDNVIAFDRIVLLIDLHLARKQPDLGYEVLRAGVMTAGE